MSATQYLALLGLWIAGIVTPGPDVLVILRNAFLGSRNKAMLTALGVMIGNIAWITLSLTGVTVLINQNHVLKLIIQIGGALFLAWMGYSSVRSAQASRQEQRRHPGTVSESAHHAAQQIPEGAGGGVLSARHLTPFRAIIQGIITNLSNAKAIVFFIALFATVVPAHAQWWESLLVAAMLFFVGLAWFCAVAWVGSVPSLAAKFQQNNVMVELVAGIVFIVVAVFLLVEALLGANPAAVI